MKLLSLFSGIGAFEKALDKLKIDYELVNYCEINKYASKSYSLIHNVPESMNLGDITKVDISKLPNDIDLITYGFPCQDISLAGKQAGFVNEQGETTRSGLFFEALRLIENCKPKIAIAENVKNLVSKKFEKEFNIVLKSLEKAGYNNYWQVLNSKNYGIPQNRERVFIVSIRKDIDDKTFEFPKPFKLELRLRDILEEKVDEKYYLSEKMIKYIVADNEKWTGNNGQALINKTIASTLNTGEGSRRCDASNYICKELPDDFNLKDTNKLIQVAQIYGTEKEPNPQAGRIYSPEGISPTLDSCSEGNRMPKVIEVPLKRGYNVEIKEELFDTTEIDVIGNYSKSNYNATAIVGKNGIAPTVRENHGQVTGIVEKSLFTETQIKMITPEGDVKRYVNSNVIDEFKEGQMADISFPNGYNKAKRTHDECPALNITTTANSFIFKESQVPLRIRKLTPKECFRLMGFKDEDFDKIDKKIISNTQLYKQAGNSIVVNVLEEIFKQLYINNKKIKKEEKYYQPSIF